MRIAFAFLVCALVSPAYAEETPPSGRFTLVPVAGGALRLDTQTGAVSLCADANGALACRPVEDEGATRAPADAGERIAALEARIAAIEARLETKPQALTDEEAVDRVGDLAEKMMRRFFGIVRELKGEMESEQL